MPGILVAISFDEYSPGDISENYSESHHCKNLKFVKFGESRTRLGELQGFVYALNLHFVVVADHYVQYITEILLKVMLNTEVFKEINIYNFGSFMRLILFTTSD
jgi:hypothetical protein